MWSSLQAARSSAELISSHVQQTAADDSERCRIAWRWRALAAAQRASQRARMPSKGQECSDR